MSDSSSIKIAAVSYLNARPLLATLPFLVEEKIPADLFALFQLGEVDAALLSLYDILQIPDAEIVDNIAIASKGAVYSVILAYEGALKDIQKITLDPASHTSNKLLQIILAEFYGLFPEYVQTTPGEEASLPRLIIGDPAIAFRETATCSILDLGEEWFRFTKLPFVFAMWCLNKKSSHKEIVAKALLLAKEEGLALCEKIAATHSNPLLAYRYFTEYIHYDVSSSEQEGIVLFQKLLKKHSKLLENGEKI